MLIYLDKNFITTKNYFLSDIKKSWFCRNVNIFSQNTIFSMWSLNKFVFLDVLLPGHRDIPDCKADELARENLELQYLHNEYGIPIATLKLELEEESILTKPI